MIVTIALDRHDTQYTNLDVVSGNVVVRNPSPTGITEITVKLEGESLSKIWYTGSGGGPYGYNNERERPVSEVHKLLYKTATVFPVEGVHQNVPGKPSTYYLDAGTHSFPFQFKFPFNNVCHLLGDYNNKQGIIGRSLEATRTGNNHTKTTLPPTVYLPPEAEVRYYIKATVRRPQLLKENPRAWENINFIPIEPPRSSNQDGETYGRRQHLFQPMFLNSPSGQPRRTSFFSKLQSKSELDIQEPISPSTEPARINMEARLPNPAILTCNADVPLKLHFKRLNVFREQIYLQTLQIELSGYTHIRAHDANKTQRHSWVICSHSNMAQPLGSPTDPAGKEISIVPEYWTNHPLPNTVAPTFMSCNIARQYEMEVRVGLGYGSAVQGKNDQFTVIPIRLAVKVYSGIAPPAAVLAAMAEDNQPPVQPPRPSLSAPSVSQGNPISRPPARPSQPPQPPQYDSAFDAPLQNVYNDPPPSYEDAIAEDLPPVDGPRPNYQPPSRPAGEPTEGK